MATSLRERLAAQKAAEQSNMNTTTHMSQGSVHGQGQDAPPATETKDTPEVSTEPNTAQQVSQWTISAVLYVWLKTAMRWIAAQVVALLRPPAEAPVGRKALRKARTKNNLLLVLVLLPVCFLAFWYYVPIVSLLTGIDRAQIHDLGVEALQPIFVGMISVVVGAVFSLTISTFIEPQLRDDAFGTWSRFGILFCLLFLGYCMVVQGLM